MRGLDLNLLPVFHALIKEAHVSRAAVRLDMPQSAASSALDRCRHLFDDSLLERTGAGMRPTAKAEALRAPLAAAMQRLTGLLDVEPPPLSEVRQAVHLVMADALGVYLGRAVREVVAVAAPRFNLVLHPWSGGRTRSTDSSAGRST